MIAMIVAVSTDIPGNLPTNTRHGVLSAIAKDTIKVFVDNHHCTVLKGGS